VLCELISASGYEKRVVSISTTEATDCFSLKWGSILAHYLLKHAVEKPRFIHVFRQNYISPRTQILPNPSRESPINSILGSYRLTVTFRAL